MELTQLSLLNASPATSKKAGKQVQLENGLKGPGATLAGDWQWWQAGTLLLQSWH